MTVLSQFMFETKLDHDQLIFPVVLNMRSTGKLQAFRDNTV